MVPTSLSRALMSAVASPALISRLSRLMISTGVPVVKAALATYTFEHMEIGSYRILESYYKTARRRPN
jgi:ferritin-like metal-binding protein YciE